MSRFLVKNGRVIDPASGLDGPRDVLVEDGLIAAVEEKIEAGGTEVYDAAGRVVAPGFVDIHVHLREPGIEHAETIETGARAAAAGGFSSICCMPNTIPVNDSPTVTSFIVERARRHAIVNVFPIGAITKGSEGEQLAEIGAMKEAGAVAVSDDGMPVMNSGVMRRAMQYAGSYGLTVIDHCEDLNLSVAGDIHEGAPSGAAGVAGNSGQLRRRDGRPRRHPQRSNRGEDSHCAHFPRATRSRLCGRRGASGFLSPARSLRTTSRWRTKISPATTATTR